MLWGWLQAAHHSHLLGVRWVVRGGRRVALRKVDADFLAMIKEAEDDESKASEGVEADEK